MFDIESFRLEKDEFFAQHPESPLTKEQKRLFHGLRYFPENPALRMEVQVEQILDQPEIEIQTSTGDVQVYHRFGKFLIDFNLTYNPYCAYNEHWSCPLTPFENRLKVPIAAGEKIPSGDWVNQ